MTELQHSCPGQLAVSRDSGRLSLPGTQRPRCLQLSQVVIFSSAPGGQLFSQEPRWALSVVSETKASTYILLARLITFYLKLKFSNS